MTNLSQWFDLAEQKPWEVGVYEARLSGLIDYPSVIGRYTWWNGEFFEPLSDSVEEACDRIDSERFRTSANITHWRGLSTNPEVKKKQGNRKVTRYVVMTIYTTGGYGLPLEVFEDNKLAHAYLEKERFMHFYPLEVKTIRFRTPE